MDKHFAARLGQAIQEMALSPTQFAQKARVPQGTVSKCLRGHVPTARILLRISKASGKSVDWLLTGKEKPRKGEGYVAEKAARYRQGGAAGGARAGERVWVFKLLKVLRGADRRKRRTIKELLDVLSR